MAGAIAERDHEPDEQQQGPALASAGAGSVHDASFPKSTATTLLRRLLRDLDVQHVGAADFAADELPYDPTDPEQLAQAANFRLETRLGPLDIMPWVAGIDEDPA